MINIFTFKNKPYNILEKKIHMIVQACVQDKMLCPLWCVLECKRVSPFFSSLCHTFTMSEECLRWWMIHSERVWTLCCELLNSESFFSRADSEKDDISPKPLRNHKTHLSSQHSSSYSRHSLDAYGQFIYSKMSNSAKHVTYFILLTIIHLLYFTSI